MDWYIKYLLRIVLLFVSCIGCSNNYSYTIPKQFRSLKNLKPYSLEQPHDTVLLNRQQVVGNRGRHPIGRLMDIAIDETGRIYIADGKQRNIQVYKPSGQFITTLGRRGKGPGEFVYLISIQINKGNLFAYDNRQRRIVVFALDSLTYDHTINLGNNKKDFKKLGGALLQSFQVRHNDAFLAEFTKSRVPDNPVVGDTIRGKDFYYFLNKHGEITSKNLFKTGAPIHVMIPVGKREVGFPFDFYGKPLTVLSNDDHIYINWTDDFLVKVYSPKGVYQRAIYYPFKKAPLFPKDIRSDFVTQRTLNKMDLPKTWPALHSMKIDSKNRLWVSTIVKNKKVYQWWALNKKGKLLARFTWPRNKPIEIIKNGKVYTKETNKKTGVQQIVRYKIQMK
jgi:hypothetical protein